MRTGTATLPLHWGSTPAWLFEKMTRLAREITVAIIQEYGPKVMLEKLSDPFWFQSLGCVLGFDWHSSGLTTTVCGALKEGVRGLEKELNFFVAGGKGKTSRKTPGEIEVFSQKYSFDSQPLVYASKISAKVDNNALQDDYQLYHHNFFFTKNGRWAVVQQGMDPDTRLARRYHWWSEKLENFVNEPHAAICCKERGRGVLNLVASQSQKNRRVSTKISHEKPKKLIHWLKKIQSKCDGRATIVTSLSHPNLNLPQRDFIRTSDLNPKRLEKVFLKTYERRAENFEELLGTPGVGAKTIRALSLISELIYGAKPSYQDPARFSFAHGGKDGTPYPVDRKTYDSSIMLLHDAVKKAKIGRREKIEAIRRLRLV